MLSALLLPVFSRIARFVVAKLDDYDVSAWQCGDTFFKSGRVKDLENYINYFEAHTYVQREISVNV